MKKVLIMLLTIVASLSLVACEGTPTSVDNTTTSISKESTEETEPTTQVDDTETPTESQIETEIRYADLIPDPETFFEGSDISVIFSGTGGKSYLCQIRGYNDGEYESYVDRCKELGFTDVIYESENDGGKMFGAYTDDGKYWVEVLLGNDTGIIAVTCK